jgi:transcriptional regulator EpsA
VIQARANIADGLVPVDSIELPPRAWLDRDCLLLAIESSIRVRAHAHFFSWTQGALQTILAHNLLLYAAYDREGRMLFADVMTVQPMESAVRRDLIAPDGGFLPRLAELWRRRGRAPLVIRFDRDDVSDDEDLRRTALGFGYTSLAAHGSIAPDGNLDTFFGFVDIVEGRSDDVSLAVEIILPHLRAALIRMQRSNSPVAGRAIGRSLTIREREVLGLLQHGRSNAEIGATLSISPLTVKNHVQKLLRKLGVRNRTQAVAMDVARQWRADE